MSDVDSAGTPPAPEVQKEYVRDELHQGQVTHRGEKREAPAATPEPGSQHLGAVDDEVVPVVPLMRGPADLVGEDDEESQGNSADSDDEEDLFDPYENITPG